MNNITTVKKIKAELFIKQIQTAGSLPCEFLCDDGNLYIVKHSENGRKNKDLINEVIGSCLAKSIGLNTPDIAIVEINKNLIPGGFKIERGVPMGICFGSKKLNGKHKNLNDFVDLPINDKIGDNTIAKTFLQIILFDIWVRNNDRTYGNPNVIVEEISEKLRLIAIDHTMILAGLGFDKLQLEKSESPTIEDTLISHELFEIIRNNYGLYFENCINEIILTIKNLDIEILTKILSQIPVEWNLQDNQINSIIDFIMYRKDITEQDFNNLLNNN